MARISSITKRRYIGKIKNFTNYLLKSICKRKVKVQTLMDDHDFIDSTEI